jgi:MoaA/NifB/PqqE/SkfB family radical SAM enzyme
MDPALPRAVLDGLRGGPLREVIPSTLGEPLLWPGLDDLLDLCAGRGLLVNVTTNGTFPGRGARAWASRLLPLASDVKVSWNGATAGTAEAIMPGLDFAAALRGVRALVAARDAGARAGGRRAGISFQVTAQEGNVGEIPEIVSLAARLGVDRVKLNHLQVRAPALAPLSLRRDAGAIARWNEAVRGARAAATGTPGPGGRAVLLQNAVELSPEVARPAPAGPCPFLGREAWVLWDGRIAPCPHPEAWRGALADLGSARDHSIPEAWATPAFRDLVAGYEAHPVCRACPFRRPGGA